MMKLGILGAGMIVREFLPWLTGPESPFKVEALCSTERSAGAAQALCDQYGVPRHTTSYDELLSWVDVVYIAVPNILHVKYTRAALEAGRHVIVEKPMAPTAALAEELAELARSRGADLVLLSGDLFDGGVISSACHFVKPEKEIYEKLIADCALTPERTLFIDDTLPNVEGAMKLGINGFHMHEKGMMDRFFL